MEKRSLKTLENSIGGVRTVLALVSLRRHLSTHSKLMSHLYTSHYTRSSGCFVYSRNLNSQLTQYNYSIIGVTISARAQ